MVAVRISIALKEKSFGIKSSISGVGDVPKVLFIQYIKPLVHIHCTGVSAYKARVIALYSLSGGDSEAQVVILQNE